MKTKLSGFLTLFLVLIVQFTFAQEKTITGTVTDESGPLPGVSIIIKGTTTGTETDFDGNYSIKANAGDMLVFSFVGMTTQEKTVGAANTIEVVMQADNVLDEVVVTALGVSRAKKSLGYSTQVVSGDAVSENKATNITNALAGKVAGVQVKSSSGNIGGSTKVLLRGVSSISGSNTPLYVIDGTPVSSRNFNTSDQQVGAGGKDFGNLSVDINPNDIESINVLKGGAATALYGSRGGNGVIMITTKKGKKGENFSIELNSGVTFDKVYILPDYQNEYAGGYSQTLGTFNYDPNIHPASYAAFDGQNILEYGADESWGPRINGQLVRHWDSWLVDDPAFGELRPLKANPNNVRNFFETGITSTSNLALTGSSDKSMYRLSIGNNSQSGMMPNSSLQVNSVAFSGSYDFGKLKASASINYIRTHVKGRPTTGYDFSQGKNVVTSFNQWFQRQLDINILRDKYKSSTGQPQSWNILSPINPKPAYWDNPYWILNESYEEDWRDRVYGNVNLTYKFNDHLSLSGIARSDFYNFRIEDRVATYSLVSDEYNEQVRIGKEDNFELFLSFDKSFNDNIDIAVNLQANKRINTYNNNSGTTQGGLNVPNWFNLRASSDRPLITDYHSKKVVNSLSAFGTIGLYDLFYIDWSARNEWSSSLPKDNNSYFYPSVSGSFIFSELIDSHIISFGKLRAGWAKIRQDTDPYQLYNIYSAQNPIGSYPSFSVPNTLNNEDLKPELSEEYEVGLELKMFSNRLGLDLTYYDKVNTDLILPLDVSGTTGVTSAWINAGKMTNKGWEVALTASPVRTENFSWNIGLNWSTNENMVVELAPGIDNYLIDSWGPSVNARKGEPYGSIVTDGFVYDKDGNREVFVDDDGNYLYSRESTKIVGNVTPDYVAGLNNQLRYKNLSLGFLIDMQKGGSIYSVSNRYGDYSGLNARTVGLNDKGNPIRDAIANGGGVRVDGVDSSGKPVTGYSDAVTYFKHLRTRRENYVYDASYIKLREVTLSYNLPKKLIANTMLDDVRLSLVGRNLWLISSNAPNIDPEATLGSGNTQGFENGQIPSTRSIGFNINLKF